MIISKWKNESIDTANSQLLENRQTRSDQPAQHFRGNWQLSNEQGPASWVPDVQTSLTRHTLWLKLFQSR